MEIRWRQPMFLGLLAIVLIAALWLGPRMVDQARLRMFAAPQLQRALKHGVAIDGPVHLALLPQPKLVAEDVTLSRAGQHVASIARVETSLKLLPLFSGRLQPAEMKLVHPVVTLSRPAPAPAAIPSAETAPAPPAAPQAIEAAPAIPRIIIEDGSVSWGSGAGLASIDGTGSLQDGEISINGHAVWRGTGFALTARWSGQGSEADLRLDRGGDLHWRGQDQGKLSGKIADLSALSPQMPALPAQLSADLQWSGGQIELGNILLSLGDADWRGKGSVSLAGDPKAELALHGTLFDLDRLPKPQARTVANSEHPAVAVEAAPPIAWHGLTAQVSLSADQLLWRGKILQDAKLSLSTGKDEITVNQASVTLPGNSEVALFGVIAAGPSFEGSFEGKSDDLRQLLRWAGSDPERVPADRLRVARVKGEIKAKGDEVDLDKVRLKLDSSQADLSGSWKPDNVSVHFALDALNADAYWLPPAKTPPADGAPAPAGEAIPSKEPLVVAFDGSIGKLSWHGVGIDNLTVEGKEAGGHFGAVKARAHTQDLGRTLRGFGLDLPLPAPADIEATIDGPQITMDRLTSPLYGGQLTGNGAWDGNGLSLHLALRNAQMHQALLDAADVGLADGQLEADADLAAAGRNPAEMKAHLGGTARIAVTDGQIKGFDLKAADRALSDKPNVVSLLMLLQSGLTGGATHFSSLTGTAAIASGVIVTNDLKLVADGGGAVGAAKIDLPADSIDSHADFRFASAADAPPLTMRMTGSLQYPHRYLDIKPLQTWLTEHGVKGGKPKDVLKGLLQGLSK